MTNIIKIVSFVHLEILPYIIPKCQYITHPITGKKIYLAGKEKYYNADDLCDDLVDNYFPNIKKIDDKTS